MVNGWLLDSCENALRMAYLDAGRGATGKNSVDLGGGRSVRGMCPSHGERRNGECAMRHKNISPADATDRPRNHAGCLSTTQIAPPVRRIGTDMSQAERDVENVECGVLDVR